MTNLDGVLQFLLSCQNDFTLASMLMKPYKLRKGCHKLRRVDHWLLAVTPHCGPGGMENEVNRE